jgi:hypothetical protein
VGTLYEGHSLRENSVLVEVCRHLTLSGRVSKARNMQLDVIRNVNQRHPSESSLQSADSLRVYAAIESETECYVGWHKDDMYDQPTQCIYPQNCCAGSMYTASTGYQIDARL